MRKAYAALVAARVPCADCGREVYDFERERREDVTLCPSCAIDRDEEEDEGFDGLGLIFDLSEVSA